LAAATAPQWLQGLQHPSAKAEWPTMTRKDQRQGRQKRRRKREKTGDNGKEKEDIKKEEEKKLKKVQGGEKSRKRTISTDRETTWHLKTKAEDRGE
jgi:hypothetical protein